ncbi:kinase-like domain-containing protein [Xylariaceae sp. AK1471]|nr:kinase-like domain-containing protein [Xylariaceae sp. AK1471]
MDSILTELLRPWRLDARKKDGDWYHDLSSSTECWREVKHLGSGTFGDVSQELCISASSQNAVRAVKRISKRQAHFSQSSKRELEALITFSQPQYHQHFVRFLGWFEDSVDLYIAMEFIQHGNLQQYIDQGVFPEPEAASVTTQVGRALQYMHQKHFVHRDLKPMNILVSQLGPQWRIKVADFGIAKHTDGTAAATLGIGTPGYMAPELYGSSDYTSAVDVWALGAVAFCMRTGFPPFRTHMQLYDYHRDQTHFPVRALGSSSGFCMNFVLGTMNERPERRLTIEQVLAHDWLAIHTGETNYMDVHSGAAMTSTWGIEPRNAWSDTYNGTSTVQQSLPTVVLENDPQHTDPWRAQSMPANALPGSQPRSPSPLAAPTSVKARTWGIVPQHMQQTPVPPPLLDAARPEIPRADTTSSITSWQTGGSDSTNISTSTGLSSAPVSPPATQPASISKPVTQAGSSEPASRNAGPTWGFFEPTIVPPQYYSSSHAAEPSSTPPTSSIPTTQIASSDLYLACETCGKTFKTREYLMAHVKARGHSPQIDSELHGADAVKPPSTVAIQTTSDPYLTCETCGKTFKERSYLIGHVKARGHSPQTNSKSARVDAVEPPSTTATQTTNDPYLTCETCGKTFKERNYLMGHVEVWGHKPQLDSTTHQVKPRLPSPPPLTGSTAATPTTSKAYLTCRTCDKIFKEREYLMRHVEARGHEPEIGTRVAPSSNMREETASSTVGAPERSNDGSPWYLTCGTCNKTFARREGLDTHTATRGHKPQVQVDPRLTCIACKRSFSERNHLFEHLEQTGHARNLDTGGVEEYTRPKSRGGWTTKKQATPPTMMRMLMEGVAAARRSSRRKGGG